MFAGGKLESLLESARLVSAGFGHGSTQSWIRAAHMPQTKVQKRLAWVLDGIPKM